MVRGSIPAVVGALLELGLAPVPAPWRRIAECNPPPSPPDPTVFVVLSIPYAKGLLLGPGDPPAPGELVRPPAVEIAVVAVAEGGGIVLIGTATAASDSASAAAAPGEVNSNLTDAVAGLDPALLEDKGKKWLPGVMSLALLLSSLQSSMTESRRDWGRESVPYS